MMYSCFKPLQDFKSFLSVLSVVCSLIMSLWYSPCAASQMALCGLTDKGVTTHEVHT